MTACKPFRLDNALQHPSIKAKYAAKEHKLTLLIFVNALQKPPLPHEFDNQREYLQDLVVVVLLVVVLLVESPFGTSLGIVLPLASP